MHNKVIEFRRGAIPPTIPPGAIATAAGHTATVSPASLTAHQMVRLTLKSASVDPSCSSIIETYEAAARFADKLASFFTNQFPSANPIYGSALCEVLDIAAVGFNAAAGTNDPRTQLARFMAHGVMAATNALMCFGVRQQRGDEMSRWEPWSDGALADWVRREGALLHFEPAFAPTAEQRYATRGMLQQRLLRYKDSIDIARAGIDLQSLDLF